MESILATVWGLSLAGRFVAGGCLAFALRKKIWHGLLGGLGCAVVSVLLPVLWQAGRIESPRWKWWVARGALVTVAVLAAVLIGDSEWLRQNTTARDIFLNLVLLCSSEAAMVDAGRIVTFDGVPIELSTYWRLALVLGAVGIALGATFFRNAVAATLGLATTGFVAGALLSASYSGWMIDHIDALEGTIELRYLVTFSLPFWLAPWLTLVVLEATILRKTSSISLSDR